MSMHYCHARNCKVPVPRKMFMCKRHWRMVPYELKVAIWAEYQPGQENLEVTPSREYIDITQEAIEAVWAKENK